MVGDVVLDTTGVVGAAPAEMLLGARHDAHPVLAGFVYVDVEKLDVNLGTTRADVLNIRGTSVPTTVRTGGGDDTVVIASDALVLSTAAASTVPHISGRTDYVEAALTIDGGATGRNRLLVSDRVGTVGRTGTLLAGSMQGIAPADILYSGADYTRGISVWLGQQKDSVVVNGTYGPDANGKRTVTSVYTGAGDDVLTVVLTAGTDGFFVGGTEEGHDVIYAGESTLPLVLVGGTESDAIVAGQGGDIIFADEGTALFGGVDTLAQPHTSTAPLSGGILPPSDLFTSVCAVNQGNDTVTASSPASFVIFGGGGNDTIVTGSGEDVVLADYGIVRFTSGLVTRVESSCGSEGGDDTVITDDGADIVLGGNGVDTLTSNAQSDVLVGDHAVVTLQHAGGRLVTSVAAHLPGSGSGDVISSGSGDDVVVGGPGSDTVRGGNGRDVIFGDYGRVDTPTVASDFTFTSLFVDESEASGTLDTLYGGADEDIVVGGQGADTLYGEGADDWLIGDHGNGSVSPSVSTLRSANTIAPVRGGPDVVEGGPGNDLIAGGYEADTLRGDADSDVIFGDYGSYRVEAGRALLVSTDTTYAGGGDVITAGEGGDFLFGGSANDTLTGGNASDWIFGDHGHVELSWGSTAAGSHVVPAGLVAASLRVGHSLTPADGEADVVVAGGGADFVFGGRGGDTLAGEAGDDVIFGDHGSVTLNTTDAVYESVHATVASEGGGDTVTGGTGNDHIFGGQGKDILSGNDDDDRVFGDFGIATLLRSAQPQNFYVSIFVAHGDADTIDTHHGKDYVFGGAGGDTIDTRQVGGSPSPQTEIVFGDHGAITEAGTYTDFRSTATELAAWGGADNITTDIGSDVVFGGQGGDVITTGRGDDTVFGDFGNVTRWADSQRSESVATSVLHGGADTISAQEDDDTVFGGVGNDTILAGVGHDVVFGDHGQVMLNGADSTVESVATENDLWGGADTIIGNDGNDTIFGGQGGDSITGDNGYDIVFGDHGKVTRSPSTLSVVLESTSTAYGGADTIETHADKDIVFGGSGGDSIDANTGDDIVFGDHGKAAFVGTETVLETISPDQGGADTIIGHDGNDTIFGGQDGDNITGDGGDDIVFGDHGKVTLQPDAATVLLESTSAEFGGEDTIETHSGADVVFGGTGGDDIHASTEDDVVFGDHGRAHYVGTLTVLESQFTENDLWGGADTIIGHDGHDTIFGGQDGDNITGDNGDDIVFGDHGKVTRSPSTLSVVLESTSTAYGGADTIRTHADKDIVFGGSDSDNIDVNTGNDIVFGDHGKAAFVGTETVLETISPDQGGADSIIGHDGNDTIFGGQDGDNITGDGGDDIVFGDHGKVTLQPDAATVLLESTSAEFGGEDTIETHSGADVVFGGTGGDDIHASTEDDVVFGDHGRAHYVGTLTVLESQFTENDLWGGADIIIGHDGNDTIFGGQDGDNITGDSGDDIVFGDHGKVTLSPEEEDGSLALLVSTSTPFGGVDRIDTHSGNDYVFGGAAGDFITTDDGDDVVFSDHGAVNLSLSQAVYESTSTEVVAHGGADTVDTGAGDDLVFGGQLGDLIQTHSGADTVFGDFGRVEVDTSDYPVLKTSTSPAHGGADDIDAGDGVNHVFGGAGGDVVVTGKDSDVVFGDHGAWLFTDPNSTHITSTYTGPEHNGGNDHITSGAGNDIVLGGQGGDIITANAGDDWVFGDQGSVRLQALQVVESIAATSGGDDTISGNEGNDYIVGGVGSDVIFGGSNEDHIFGDSGAIQQAEDPSVGTRSFTAIFTTSEHGANDTIDAGTGDDFVMGQQGGDVITGQAGHDMLFGDHAEAEVARSSHLILWAGTTSPVDGLGGDDLIFGNNGEDYLIGGTASDTLHGGPGADIILGDHALFNASEDVLHQYQSIFTAASDAGSNDTVYGGSGDDVILGQQGDDTLYGNAGEDDITGGHDVLDGDDGDDTIDGGADADVVLGDNGEIMRFLYAPPVVPPPPSATPTPATRPHFCEDYEVLTGQQGELDHSDYGKNERKCWTTACHGETVTLTWDSFDTEKWDDTVSLYTVDAAGDLNFVWVKSGSSVPQGGTYGQDVMIMFFSDRSKHEDGFKVRYTCSAPTPPPPTPAPAPLEQMYESGPPYVHGLRWQRHGVPFADLVRVVQRFDDVDKIAGDDTISGGSGDDILHGQRGDDTIHGDGGADEVYGEQGNDVLHGGAGPDVVIGDMGLVVRAFQPDGSPRANVKTGAWHRDVVLEEQAQAAPLWIETSRDTHPAAQDAAALLGTDVLLSSGAYEQDGETKQLDLTRSQHPWHTVLHGLNLLDSGNDVLAGDDGDDVLIGQRGNDIIDGGAGNDYVYGDTVSSVYHYDSCLPLVATVVRLLRDSRDATTVWGGKAEVPFFGHVLHTPVWMLPEQTSRAAAMRPIDDAAVATLIPADLEQMLLTVGTADLTLTGPTNGKLRPFVAVVPDTLRHGAALYGNDDLSGGAGNDVVVGDAAFHHAMLNLEVKALEEVREHAAARRMTSIV